MNRLSLLAIVLTATGAFVLGWQVRDSAARRDAAREQAAHAQALAAAVRTARTVEHHLSLALADIGDRHETAQHHAAAVEADVLADLRAGTVRLRREWQHCETRRVSELAAATAGRDAATADRDALAAAVVRAGRDADEHTKACQAVIRAYRAAMASGDGT